MKGYDWKKTLMKGVKIGVPVIIAGIASIYGNSPWFLAIAPALSTVANYLKHNHGLDLKIV